MEAYAEEDDYIVWEGMNRVIGGVKEMLEFTDLASKFNTYVLNLLNPQRQRLGWDASADEGVFYTRDLIIPKF